MADGKAEDFVKSVVEGIKYFGKAKKGVSPQMEKMEKAIEGTSPPPVIPPVPPPVTPPITPTPVPPVNPELQSALRKRSVAGSKPFSDAELKKGYRKL